MLDSLVKGAIMKKVIVAIIGMFLLMVWPGAAIWQFISKILGGGISEGYIYPIYGGMILLAGIIVGCTVVVLEEIKSLKEEIRKGKNANIENE